MSAIPTAARAAVRLREHERCLRCGAGSAHDIHHRMRRRNGGHTLENMVLLCRTCHAWAHGHPAEARDKGFIVSFSGDVAAVAVHSWRGRLLLNQDGTFAWAPSQETTTGE